MLNTSFAPWPSYSQEEADAISKLLLSNKVNYWTGDHCKLFEDEFADWVGVKHAVALSNGTLALDLALRAIDILPGDEVIVTPRTFIASVSCVVNAGATPVFADVDLNSGNITAQTISSVLTKKTKAIICVHLAGWPCDMDPIMDLANKYKLKVIEDCAQAHGALYKGRSVGSIGHVGAWSFCQDKIMTTGGEGGMVTTNDQFLWEKMWSYKDHGKSYRAVYERDHPPGFRWLHESFGTNFRMLELQAIIGRIQLKKMSEWSQKRLSNTERILKTCKQFSAIRVPQFRCNQNCELECSSILKCFHANYKCYVYINPEKLRSDWSRGKIIKEINQLGVPCYEGSCSEVYLEKAFDATNFRPKERLINAKKLGDSALMFLVHPTLTEDNLVRTEHVLKEVLTKASF